MAGLDVYLSVFRTLEKGLGSKFAPPERLVSLVETGRYGTKHGGGFRDYDDEERARILIERDATYAEMATFLASRREREAEA
jgi:3-hydroxybutyryl-CoA dehydrogenase